MKLRFGLLLIALGLLASAATASAERAALFLGSTAKGVDRPALIKIARAQAEAAGWSVTEPPLADGPLGDLIVCVQSGLARDCIPGHLDDNDVDRGIVIAIGQEGGSAKPTWVATGWVFRRTGDLLVTDRRYCEGCKTDKLADTVRDLTDTLVTEARARAKPTVILARSKPAGATVFVDDQKVGVSELEAPVYAGVHNVRFELEGHQSEVREVAIGDGETLTVEVTLKETKVVPPPGGDDRPKPSRVLPIAVMAGGAALVIGGVVLLAMDEDPVQDGAQVPEYSNTAWPGIGLAAAGAATIGAGVWLWLRGSKSDERTPVASITPDGAWLGYAGRF